MINAYIVKPSNLEGAITAPPSKSHTMRAILFASLAKGRSKISRYLNSPDTKAMIVACRSIGAKIDVYIDYLEIEGVCGKPSVPEDIIDAGNSGQILRFFGSVTSLTSGYAVITGDDSVKANRPIGDLLNGLSQLGALAVSISGGDYAPMLIRGTVRSNAIKISGKLSQTVSALLITSAFLDGKTTIFVDNPCETPWVMLTLDWFDRLGIKYENHGNEYYCIYGGQIYNGFNYIVPGDFSSSAYPLVASLITGSELIVNNLDMNDSQGDKELLSILEIMGANIRYDLINKSIKIYKSCILEGREIDVSDFIDAVPILAVVGCFARGVTIIKGASTSRQKECNRIEAICMELSKLGANIEETHDGLKVCQSNLHSAKLDSHKDHRIAMSLVVAAMMCNGEIVINDIACVDKSYPDFLDSMQNIGVKISLN